VSVRPLSEAYEKLKELIFPQKNGQG
jgi:hypothetical protein